MYPWYGCGGTLGEGKILPSVVAPKVYYSVSPPEALTIFFVLIPFEAPTIFFEAPITAFQAFTVLPDALPYPTIKGHSKVSKTSSEAPCHKSNECYTTIWLRGFGKVWEWLRRGNEGLGGYKKNSKGVEWPQKG